MSDSEAIRALAFEFASLLADPDFRRIVRKAGGRKRRDVIVAHSADAFDSVMSRTVKQSRPPVLLFIKLPDGYTLIRVDPKPKLAAMVSRLVARKRTIAPLRILPTTTIGEIAIALERHDQAVAPERWGWFRLTPVNGHALAH